MLQPMKGFPAVLDSIR